MGFEKIKKIMRPLAASAMLAGSNVMADSETVKVPSNEGMPKTTVVEKEKPDIYAFLNILEGQRKTYENHGISKLSQRELDAYNHVLELIEKEKELIDIQNSAKEQREKMRKQYSYLPEELIDHIDRNPLDILRSEMEGRRDLAPEFKMEADISSGRDIRRTLDDFRKNKEKKIEPMPLAPRGRRIGDIISEYDRVLHVQRLKELHEQGRIPDNVSINIPRKFGNESEISAAISRSLTFLKAKDSGDLTIEQREKLEQEKIAELFGEKIEEDVTPEGEKERPKDPIPDDPKEDRGNIEQKRIYLEEERKRRLEKLKEELGGIV